MRAPHLPKCFPEGICYFIVRWNRVDSKRAILLEEEIEDEVQVYQNIWDLRNKIPKRR